MVTIPVQSVRTTKASIRLSQLCWYQISKVKWAKGFSFGYPISCPSRQDLQSDQKVYYTAPDKWSDNDIIEFYCPFLSTCETFGFCFFCYPVPWIRHQDDSVHNNCWLLASHWFTYVFIYLLFFFLHSTHLIEYLDIISIVIIGKIEDAITGVGANPFKSSQPIRNAAWLHLYLAILFWHWS